MTNNETLPPKNHNNPPEEISVNPKDIDEKLTLKYVHSIRTAEGYIALVGQMPDHFTEEMEAQYITEQLKLMSNMSKHLEDTRKREKDPYLRAGQFVDNFFNDVKDKLNGAIIKANKPLTDWLQRKAREEQEARDRDAKLMQELQASAMQAAATVNAEEVGKEEAAAVVQHAIDVSIQARTAQAIAAAPVTSMVSTKASNSTAGLAEKWVGTVVKAEDLDLTKLRPYISLKELDAALQRFVKAGGRQCEGAKIEKVIDVKVK